MDGSVTRKSFVVTGATSGIGLAVARQLVGRGFSVIGVGRSQERCDQAESKLRSIALPESHIKVLVADLSLQCNIHRLAGEVQRLLADWGCAWLDGLINNAATVPFWQIFTPEGFDMQWAVNHLAPFLLTSELLPCLEAAPQARIVTVSSDSHLHARLNWEDIQLRRHYNPLRAYEQTKLANVLFTLELSRRLQAHPNVRAFAADPGLVNTEIGLKSNSFLARWVWDIRRRGGVSPEQPAAGIVFLATDPSIQAAKEIYWKDCRPKSPSAYALNAEAAGQLWKLSARMCGLES